MPCGRNGVLSVASFSSDVSRGASSTVASPQPASAGSRVATVTRSGCSLPLAYALAVFSCEARREPVGPLLGDARAAGRAGSPRSSPSPGRTGRPASRPGCAGSGRRPRPSGGGPCARRHRRSRRRTRRRRSRTRPSSRRSSRRRTCGRWRSRARCWGRPASSAAVRPMVRPWSPIWVVAAIATSSTRSGGSCGLRRRSSRMQRMTRSSARVPAYMPPALPKGVRTPSTKTTSRDVRDITGLLGEPDVMLLVGNLSLPATPCVVPVTRRGRLG